jgi:putative ABC transport system ATP-binding protein
VLEQFRRLHGNRQTILLVTHDHEIAAAAQRVTQMRDGGLTDDGRGSAMTRAVATGAET